MYRQKTQKYMFSNFLNNKKKEKAKPEKQAENCL